MKQSEPWTLGDKIWVSISVSIYTLLMLFGNRLGVHPIAVTMYFVVAILVAKSLSHYKII